MSEGPAGRKVAVVAGLVPAIHVVQRLDAFRTTGNGAAWMAGTSPAMTDKTMLPTLIAGPSSTTPAASMPLPSSQEKVEFIANLHQESARIASGEYTLFDKEAFLAELRDEYRDHQMSK